MNGFINKFGNNHLCIMRFILIYVCITMDPHEYHYTYIFIAHLNHSIDSVFYPDKDICYLIFGAKNTSFSASTCIELQKKLYSLFYCRWTCSDCFYWILLRRKNYKKKFKVSDTNAWGEFYDSIIDLHKLQTPVSYNTKNKLT